MYALLNCLYSEKGLLVGAIMITCINSLNQLIVIYTDMDDNFFFFKV